MVKSGTSYGTLVVTRSPCEGIADGEARHRRTLLVHRVQRAVSNGSLIERYRDQSAVLADILSCLAAAVFLVDASGRVAFANEPAQSMLRGRKILRDGQGFLLAVDPQANRTLQDAFAASGGYAALGVRGVAILLSTSQDECWIAHVLPLTSGARRQTGATL